MKFKNTLKFNKETFKKNKRNILSPCEETPDVSICSQLPRCQEDLQVGGAF